MRLNKRFELATGKKEDLTLTVSLKMAKCSSCGRFFTPERLLKKTVKELTGEEFGTEGQEWLSRCPECRKNRTAKALVGLEGMEHA
jgi:hydrogenase-4 component H